MVGERPSKSDAGAGSVACGLDIADDEPRSHGDGDVALVLHEGPHISGRESLVGDAVVPDQVTRREWRPATRQVGRAGAYHPSDRPEAQSAQTAVGPQDNP